MPRIAFPLEAGVILALETDNRDMFKYTDTNGDGVADLAAGASGENVGSVEDAGAVSVLYGSAVGLTTAGGRLFIQVGSAAEEQDWFGWALAAGDFKNDGFADLAAGAPFETVSNAFAAGAVRCRKTWQRC